MADLRHAQVDDIPVDVFLRRVRIRVQRYEFSCARGHPHAWFSRHGSAGVCFGRLQLWVQW